MSKTISKLQLTELMRNDTGATKEVCEQVIDLFIENIRTLVVDRGAKVTLNGIGTFEAKLKPERMGRNPKTKEPAVIKARHRLSFAASRTFKKSIA